MNGAGPEAAPAPRVLRVVLRPEPDAAGEGRRPRGLFRADPRVRTLLKVLASYPEVRYVLPDRISLEADTRAPLLEAVARFLERQAWLVERVEIG